MTTLSAIVLAGGEGRRMGGPKALLEIDGRALVARHVERLCEVGCSSIVVVVRDDVAPAVRALVSARAAVRVVAVSTSSQSASLAAGVRVLSGTRDDVVVVVPVDMWPAEPATHHALLAALGGATIAVTPVYRGRGGHPIVVRRSVLEAYESARTEAPTLRDVLAQMGDARRRVEVDDDGVLGDLDTPSDLAAFVSRRRHRRRWALASSWFASCLVACGSPRMPSESHARERAPTTSRAGQGRDDVDPMAKAARLLVRDGCDRATTDGSGIAGGALAPVPTWRERSAAETAPFDVVVYTAHPDDEAMYVGGTMDRLVRAGRRVAFVTMSHGEGGRLLERGDGGAVEERRDYPRAHVVEVRDREVADAARQIGVAFAQLYPGSANVDDAWTTSCAETLARWEGALPGGLAAMLQRLVEDLRTRRPRVVITLDPRDDPQASHHGHHKAVGVLVEIAARLAADPSVRDGRAPHVVEELLTAAPRSLPADQTVTVSVDVGARIRMLNAYMSQFLPEELANDAVAQRPNEHFVLRWRALGAPAAKDGSRLLDLLRADPAAP